MGPGLGDWRRGRHYVGMVAVAADDMVESTGKIRHFWLFVQLAQSCCAARYTSLLAVSARPTFISAEHGGCKSHCRLSRTWRTLLSIPVFRPAYVAAASPPPAPDVPSEPRVLAGTLKALRAQCPVSAKDIRASRIAKPGAGARGTAVTTFRETVIQQKAASYQAGSEGSAARSSTRGEARAVRRLVHRVLLKAPRC